MDNSVSFFKKGSQTSGFHKSFWPSERQSGREILRHITYLVGFITFAQAYTLSEPVNLISAICSVGHTVYKGSLNQSMHWSYAYWNQYKKCRGAEGSIPTGVLIKSLARRWKETSYSDQHLQHYIKIYGYKQQEYIPVVCSHKSWFSVVSLGRCSRFPSSLGLRTFQHPCTSYSKDHEYKTQLCGRQYWLVPCSLYRMLRLLDNTA